MKNCPLCGRKYVKEELVVLPPTKEEVLSQWRARRRAEKAASAAAAPAVDDTTESAAPAETVIPAARTSEESATWTFAALSSPVEVQAKLLSVGAAAMFVSAFALGESVMALTGMSG